MNLADAVDRVRKCAQQMNARYGKTVFDEWALVSLKRGEEKIVHYTGPRRDDFQKNFSGDLGQMRAELLTTKHAPGHYDFARHAVGTSFEAFVCVGADLYLICNNTQRSMDDITREGRWLEAQKAFAEMTEEFSGDAVAA
jgi:hypothetical protein